MAESFSVWSPDADGGAHNGACNECGAVFKPNALCIDSRAHTRLVLCRRLLLKRLLLVRGRVHGHLQVLHGFGGYLVRVRVHELPERQNLARRRALAGLRAFADTRADCDERAFRRARDTHADDVRVYRDRRQLEHDQVRPHRHHRRVRFR